jgi:transposase-like protein
MKPTPASKGSADICTEPWIPEGQTSDFLIAAKRDAAAAKRCFRKVLLDPANPQPRVINVEKN